jgi:GTP cyclohydrolase I
VARNSETATIKELFKTTGNSEIPMQDKTLEKAYASIIDSVGEDLDRPGLKDTPSRAAKAMQFLTQGYNQDINEIVNDALFPTTSNEMVIVKNIELYSLCEHHLLPFIGKCHVAYLPCDSVLGLSKVARIVDVFARRLQIQEHLTQQIAETILEITNARGVGVIIESQHMCMMMRGVEKQNSVMTTSCMLGAFRDKQGTRSEFLSLIN